MKLIRVMRMFCFIKDAMELLSTMVFPRRTTLPEENSVQDESGSFTEINSPKSASSSQGSYEPEDNEDVRLRPEDIEHEEVDSDHEGQRALESPECTGIKRRYPGSAVISI